MASQSPPPADAEVPPSAPPAPPAAAEKGGVFEYVDLTPRTYQFAGAPPQTAEFGDVCALPRDPGDGHWLAVKKKVTRLPDNHPDQMEIASKRQSAARVRAHLMAEADRLDALDDERDAAASGKA
jgi:hypothetical protein